MLLRPWLVVAVVTLTLTTLMAVGGAAATAERDENEPEFDGSRAMSEERPAEADFAAVEAQARERGTARAIVGLRVDFTPEGHMSPAQAQRQRSDIAAARRRLLDDVAGADVEVARTFDTVPFVAVTASEGAVDALRGSRHVASVEIDRVLWPELAHTTPLQQADVLHDDGTTGAGQLLAILDTGVDSAHAAFGDRVVEEACYSTDDPAQDWTSLCPDGSEEQLGDGAGVNCDVGDVGRCFHGTHVAGIAAGDDDAYRGVAPGADVMAVQVFTRFGQDQDCPGLAPCIGAFAGDFMAGLERVNELHGDHDIAAANMSLGGGQQTSACDGTAIKTTIDNLRAAGTATTIATGNEGRSDAVSFPACVSTSVGVSSVTKTDEVSGFSNSHPTLVDLYAIGSEVTAPTPGGGFGASGGTSMAAPQVAGGWALLAERDPGVAVGDRLQTLQDTGTPVTDDRDPDPALHHTHPRINLAGAAELPYQPDNMRFADAAAIGSLAFADEQRTWNAVLEDDEPLASCASPDGMGPTVWYVSTPDDDRAIVADTDGSDFDTTLAVYTGSTLDDLSEVDCDDGTPEGGFTDAAVEFSVAAGQTYWLQVGGWSSLERGQAALNVDGDVVEEGAIAGTVTSAGDGGPVEGATVVADGAEATTGGDGAYALEGLEVGTYDVAVDAEGFESAVEEGVEVAADATATVDFALAQLPGAIAGTVTSAGDGGPVEGATVVADGAEATTGGDGAYALEGLEVGTYDVAVDAEGFESAVEEGVEVAADATTPVDVALARLTVREVARIAGPDRFATAAELSRASFEPGVPVAYIATGHGFADALTGGVAAALDDAPVLLATRDGIPQATATELSRLSPQRTVILGGTGVISPEVETQLAGFTDGPVDRLAGATRFATAAEISRATFADGADTVYLTTGLNFPDALAGVPAAASVPGPLLLVTDDAVPGATTDELARLDADRLVILGGTGAVGGGVASELDAFGTVERIAGAGRFATAADVSASAFADAAAVDTAYVATGGAFPDALAAGAVAGAEPSPVLLVGTDHIPGETADELARLGLTRIVVMGGTAAVSATVEQQLEGLLGE